MSPGLTPVAARGAAVAALLACAGTWGVSWWPFRYLEQAGVHALWATALLSALACAMLSLAWARAWARLWRRPALWWLVLASGLTNASFNWAVTVGEVARAVLLFHLAPVWTVLLAHVWLGERASRRELLCVALALGGALLVLAAGPAHGGATPAHGLAPGLADGLALLGGLGFALNNVLVRRLGDESGPARALAMFLGGGLLSALAAWAGVRHGWVPAPPPPAWGWGGMLVAVALMFVLANLALQYGAARLPAVLTAVVMPSEILFAMVSAQWWAGERPSGALWLGGVLILAAALSAAREAG